MTGHVSWGFFWALIVSLLLHFWVLRFGALERPKIVRQTPIIVFPVRIKVLPSNATPLNTSVVVADPNKPFANTPTNLVQSSPELTEGKVEQVPKNISSPLNQYFKASELDRRPTAVRTPDLALDEMSPLSFGKAIFVIYINANGLVDKLEVEQSTLPQSVLDALQQQRDQLQFTPGAVNGVDVNSVIRYEFELRKTEVTEMGRP